MPKIKPPDGSKAARRLAAEDLERDIRWAELERNAIDRFQGGISNLKRILRTRALRTLDNGQPLTGDSGGTTGAVLTSDLAVRAEEILALIDALNSAETELAQTQAADWDCLPIDWDPGPIDGAGDYACGQGGVCRLPAGLKIKVVMDATVERDHHQDTAIEALDNPQAHTVRIGDWTYYVGPDEIVGVIDDND